MSYDRTNTPPRRDGTDLWVVFVLVLAVFGGGAYLALQHIEPANNPVPLANAPVQTPSGQASATALMAPTFDAVSAEAGMLVVAGKAEPGAAVLVQNSGVTLGETKADENGEWVLMLQEPLPAGAYNLSLLSIDPKTQTRVPGRRSYALTIAPYKAPVQTAAAKPAVPTAAAQQQAKKPGSTVSVKPGDTLWAIAEHYYGRGAGMRYQDIAGANKDQVKNPDLIYPKQQFAIPGK